MLRIACGWAFMFGFLIVTINAHPTPKPTPPTPPAPLVDPDSIEPLPDGVIIIVH